MSFILLISFLFMLYASPALIMPELAALRPVQLAGVSAAAFLTLQKTISRERWRVAWPEGYLMIALVTVGVFSCFGAFWPGLAFQTTFDLAKMVVIYFLIVNCVDSEHRLRVITTTLIVGGLIPTIGTLSNYLRGIVVEGNRAVWLGTFANPNDLAYSLVILVPLAFQMGRDSRPLSRLFFWGALVLYLAAVFATHSRGGLLGALAVLLFLGMRSSGVIAKAGVAAMLVVVLAFATMYWTRRAGFQNLETDFTVHQRLETIKAGLAMFADHPLLGVGLGCSVVAWPLYASDVDFRGSLGIHNTAVLVLSELGIIGSIVLGLLIAAAIFHAWQISRMSTLSISVRNMAIAAQAALLGYLVCGLSGGYVVSWFPYILIGLVSALTYLTNQGSQVAPEIPA